MEVETPRILYQETNPYGSMTAYLEMDGRTLYLYLQSQQNPELELKAVWVQNLLPAPESRSPEDFQNGLAPILIASEIEQPSLEPPHPENLHFIWTEEGDGVALFHQDELIAFLPPWSGIQGIHGYSKYCIQEAITAHPLGDSSHGVLADRIEKARSFWEFRAQKDSWKEIQALLLDFLEERLGKHVKYWSADGGKFPPLAIAKFQPTEYSGVEIYSTIGMSAQNMPSVELYHKDYLDYSRIELVIGIKSEEKENTSETWVPHAIGEIIKFPWMMNKWLGEGHSITLPRRDPDGLLNFTHFFVSSQFPNAGKWQQPLQEHLISESGQKIKFLFLLPITEEEVYYVRSEGAKEFLNLITEKEKGWLHESDRASFL